jgi:hypothetical protein
LQGGVRQAQRPSSAQKHVDEHELEPGTTYEQDAPVPGLHAAPLAGLVAGHPGAQPGSLNVQPLDEQYP